jgi:hypothetical protein
MSLTPQVVVSSARAMRAASYSAVPVPNPHALNSLHKAQLNNKRLSENKRLDVCFAATFNLIQPQQLRSSAAIATGSKVSKLARYSHYLCLIAELPSISQTWKRRRSDESERWRHPT